MCRNLNLSSKRIATLFFVLLALALPLSAKASWTGLLAKEATTDSSGEVPQDLGKLSVEEFSQELSTTVSRKGKIETSKNLTTLVEALRQKLIASQTSTDKLLIYATTLEEQLEELKANEKISEEEYKEIKRVCEELTANVDERGETIVEQQKQIIKLDKENQKYRGIRPYVGMSSAMNFSGGKPLFGIGVDAGVKLGKSLMVIGGASYALGTPSSGNSLDRWGASVRVGWIF